MKTFVSLAILSILTATVSADAPRQAPVTKYSTLWTNSPFTSKPPPPGDVIEENPLEDYALGGISKLSDGYFAILFHKKKPDEKIVIQPGVKSDFEVVGVDWNRANWKETIVTVRNGGTTGTVGFDDKLLVVKAAPQQAKKLPVKAGTIKKPAPGTTPGGRQPRPRVVVPQKKK